MGIAAVVGSRDGEKTDGVAVKEGNVDDESAGLGDAAIELGHDEMSVPSADPIRVDLGLPSFPAPSGGLSFFLRFKRFAALLKRFVDEEEVGLLALLNGNCGEAAACCPST